MKKFWFYTATVIALLAYALLIFLSVLVMVYDSAYEFKWILFLAAIGIVGVWLVLKKRWRGVLVAAVATILGVITCRVAGNAGEWNSDDVWVTGIVFVIPVLLLLSVLPIIRKMQK